MNITNHSTILSYSGTSVNILSNVSQYQLSITYFGMYKCKMGLIQLKKKQSMSLIQCMETICKVVVLIDGMFSWVQGGYYIQTEQ